MTAPRFNRRSLGGLFVGAVALEGQARHPEVTSALQPTDRQVVDEKNGRQSYVVAAWNAPRSIQAGADYVCDGVDDQRQINWAASHGVPILSAGTFNVSDTIRSDNGLIGAGTSGRHSSGPESGTSRGTEIVPVEGFSGTAVVAMEQSNGYIVDSVSCRDFTVDCSDLAGGSVDGVRFRAFSSNLSRVIVRRAPGDGFMIVGNTGENPKWSTYDSTITDCLAEYCGAAAFHCASDAADLKFVNITGLDSRDGFRQSGGAGNQVTNFHFYGNDRNNIRHESGAGTRNHYSNGKIQHSQNGHAVLFVDNGVANPSDVQFSNCDFNSNGEGDDNTYDAISLEGTRQCNRLQLIGVTFGDSDNSIERNGTALRTLVNLGSIGHNAVITGCSFASSRDDMQLHSSGRLIRASGTALDTLTVSGCAHLADFRGPDAATFTVDGT